MKKRAWVLINLALCSGLALADQSTYLFLDLLTWKAEVSSSENWAQIIPPAGRERDIEIAGLPFKWKSGFRMGLGHVFCQNNFDLTLAYTHFDTQAWNQISGLVYSGFTGNYFVNNTNGASFGPTYSSGDSRWQLFFNTVDLNLGHTFVMDSVLTLHPYLGLKAASINNKIDSNWYQPIIATTFTSASENLKNDFKGLGPSFGVDSTWPIYRGACQTFSLMGNFAAALLWGHWSFNEIYSNNTPTTITVHSDSINGATPMLDGFLGLQWLNRFAKAELEWRLGYEAQIWFNQVQIYSYNMGKLNRLMSLQGGNLEFRVNF